jgi:hypothetical protein
MLVAAREPAATSGRVEEERVHLLGVAPTADLESWAALNLQGCREHGLICHLFELILVIHANTSNGTNHIV